MSLAVGDKTLHLKGLLRSMYTHNQNALFFIAYSAVSVLYGFCS